MDAIVASVRRERIKDQPRIHRQPVKATVICLQKGGANRRPAIAPAEEMPDDEIGRIARLESVNDSWAKSTATSRRPVERTITAADRRIGRQATASRIALAKRIEVAQFPRIRRRGTDHRDRKNEKKE